MVTIGYFLGSEERDANELVEGAVLAEEAGFTTAWVSDHFHPWLDDQGESPFVWSVLGAVARATTDLRVQTAVTCPTMRMHPVLVAQAAATTQQLFDGRFAVGVGSGENLNEHVFGDHWPVPEVRLEMLAEAIGLIRRMWTGEMVDHRGGHYTVENARLYTLPDSPPPVLVSGLGPKSTELAARVGDGYVSTMPDADAVHRYREHGGKGPTQCGLKVCWHADEDEAAKVAHRQWRNELLPGQLSQELPTPSHFEQAAQLVGVEDMKQHVACGPDPQRHVQAVQSYVDAGYDEVYVQQMGPDQAGMIDFYRREVLPQFA